MEEITGMTSNELKSIGATKFIAVEVEIELISWVSDFNFEA